ncbi:T7SS effector LXG polymorphic toxin [Liquorilactobacillus hordei]|uniref:LXG domain-containing protein n=1 Tax=Liquorilactobacillus hordei TaxID=468911 RepID=A0A3S6QRT7_9LACO|nr:T7SS effector LXG polymorphic toxin [Liquorilactobacillus hordei]AUJ29045.1 hypothetical protein BSQ49_01760 [Liquorilactobacillus hordei]
MRIDVLEVIEARQALESSHSHIESELDDAKHYLREVADSEALSGKVKTAIKNKIVNHQIPLLTEYKMAAFYISQEFNSQYEAFKGIVKENSMTAVIDTDELTRLEGKFSGIANNFNEIASRTKQVYASIDDLVAVSNVSSSRFTEQLAKSKKVLTNTRTWMADFNARKNSSRVTELLAQQNNQLTQLNSVGKIGYTATAATGLYNNANFKRQVAKELLAEKNAENKYLKTYYQDKYIWQQYSRSQVGQKVSGFVNWADDVQNFLMLKERGNNAVSLIREIAEFDKKLGGKPGAKGIYGKQGTKTIEYLQQDWRDVKKYLRGTNYKGLAQKMDGSFRHNLNRLNHKLHFNEESKFGKIVKKVDKVTSYVEKPAKSVFKATIENGSKLKIIKPLGKLATKAGWAGMIFDAGASTYQAYNDKGSQSYKNPGKSVIHAGVEQLKSAGPIEGALAGAAIGGPWGAAAGLGAGLINSGFGIFLPKTKDDFYNGMEKGLDKGWDKLSNVGKSFSKSWKSFKGSNNLRSINYE